MNYTNCAESAASQIPAFMADIQGLVNRSRNSSIVNLWSDVQSLVQQGGSVADVNSAIDSVKSQLIDLATEVAADVGQAVQNVTSVAACVFNVKLTEKEQALNIMAGIVSCAADLGVPVTLPAVSTQNCHHTLSCGYVV